MAEAELHVLRTRMREGALHKAAKGELRISLPAGFDYDELGRIRITADEAVADAIATVFAYFDAARQRTAGDAAPGRRGAASCPAERSADRQVRWAPASYRAVHDILTNPCYAGVYAYRAKAAPSGTSRTAWCASGWCLRAARGVARLPDRAITPDTSRSSATRLTRRGCAPTVSAAARGRQPGRRARGPGAAAGAGALRALRPADAGRLQRPVAVPTLQLHRGPSCMAPRAASQSAADGSRQLVLDAVFQALAPAAIDATLRAIEHADRHTTTPGALGRAGARARAPERRARTPPVRPLRAREPARRTHAGERVGTQLVEVSHAEQQLAAIRARRPAATDRTRRSPGAGTLALTCARCFDAPTTTVRDRKLLLRAMITDIVVTVEREQHHARWCASSGRAAPSPTTS